MNILNTIITIAILLTGLASLAGDLSHDPNMAFRQLPCGKMVPVKRDSASAYQTASSSVRTTDAKTRAGTDNKQ